MKQKKYLGRRIFALCLALLLSLNTATAYASGDMPAASESSKTVSETSDTFVDGENFETTETDETETADGSGEITVEKPAEGSEETDPAKGDDGGVTSGEETPSEEDKESGSEGSETEEPKTEAEDENGDAAQEKPAGGSEETDPAGDSGDVTTDADVTDEETLTEEDVTGEKTGDEELPVEETAEVPEEVKAFLDAVAALPSVDEITAENAEEIGNQVNAAFDLYDVLIDLDLGLEEREDVAAAMEKAYAVFAAVLEAEEPDTQAVQAFLDAVAAIVVPEEDLSLEENADLADSYSAAVYEALALYEALSEEQQELEEVVISFMELENMAMVLPDFGVSTYALSNVAVRPDYNPNGCIPGVSKHGGAVTKSVGESGFYKRRAVKNFYCQGCRWFYGQSSGKEYANIQWEQSVEGVISDVSFTAGELNGAPCLEMDFTGAKEGTTLVTIQYDVNFHTRWNSSYASCPGCGALTSVQQYDDSWYHYEDTFFVTVTGPRNETQKYYVYVPTNGIENGKATIELNAILPARALQWYGYTNNYNAYMPVRNPKLDDPYGVNGVYAKISNPVLTRQKLGYNYGINLTIEGLNEVTTDGKPLSVFVDYEWPYSAGLANVNDTYMYKNLQWGSNTIKAEICIVVYEPETVTILKGEDNKYTHNYGKEMTGKSVAALSYGADAVTVNATQNCNNIPKSSDTKVVNRSFYPDPNMLQRAGTSAWYYAVGIGEGTAKISTTYTYFGQYVGNKDVWVYPRTTYVDVVNYKVVEDLENKTPVSIIKEFDGITADQIPDDFELTYSISGCTNHSNVGGALKGSEATLTNADGTPRLSWNVDLPVAKHGSAVHTITFGENNAKVTGYKAPTISGNTVKLEELTAEEGATNPVITITNRYELENNVFELFYDFNGGANGPATQVYKGQSSEMSHDFNVAGSEDPAKIPTNGNKVFEGWSETLGDEAVYTYNSSTGTYAPVTVTVTKKSGENSASKTLYAVWEEYTGPKYQLDNLVKERIKTDDLPSGVTLPAGVTINDDNTVVFLGDNPAPVTLLYKITVNGTAGAKYKVTDSGAEWVSGGDAYEKKGDDLLIITGTIKEGNTSAVIYVTKTFTKADVREGRLTNEAELESDDPETKGPDDGTGSGTADAQKKYTVIINFITDDETPETLQDSSNNEFEEGEGFGFGVARPEAQRMAQRSAAGAGTVAISVPYTITKGEKVYVLDEVASKEALDALKAAGEAGVTSDMVKDLIYSPDMKGGSDPDKEEGGSDGIPDKYQAKIVYQATEGGSQDGVSGYVTIEVDGVYSKEGTVTVSATATADERYEFDNWTAEVAGDDNWTWPAQGNAELNDSISVKGGAVYTFTANFAAKGVLTVSAEDVEAIYDGGEHPVTPVVKVGGTEQTGATVTIIYVDAEGNEFSEAPVDAGTYTAKIKAELAGYDDAECEATVTIEKRKLTVNTASDSKTYDGTPLTNSTAVVTVENGAVAGEEITATATGSRTEVGSAVNTYTLNWGNAKAGNYEITEVLGTLTVHAAEGGSEGEPDPTPTPDPTPGPGPAPDPTPGPAPTPDPTPAPGPEPIIPGPVPMVGPEPVVPTVTSVTPTVTAPTPTAALASPTPEAVALADEEVPLAGEEEEKQPELEGVKDEETPLAGGNGASWALINFALMNLAIFESLMLLIGYFVKTKNDREDEEEKRKLKKKGIFRIISLPIAILSLIVFILTEDITLPTAFVDKYTVVMLIIAIVQTVMAALSNKKYEDGEEA